MIKIKWEKGKKRNRIVVGILAACLLTALAIAVFWGLKQRKMQETENDRENPPGMTAADMITGSGTTMVGMSEEYYDIDYLEEDLYIEEVYVSGGDEIEEGAKILKFTEDTITAAREQLEKAVKTAELDYRKGVIDYEQSKLEEKKSYDLNLKNGELAQGIYDDAIAELDEEIAELTAQLTEKQEELTEYQEALTQDAYYAEYEVGEKEEIFKSNYAVFYERVNEWNMAQYLITDDTDYSRVQFTENVKLSNEEKEYMSSLKNLLGMVYTYQEDYENTKKEYEKAKTEAVDLEQQTQVDIEALQLELQKAQLHYEEEITAAESAYETAAAKSDASQTTYNTAVKKLEEALEAVKAEKEDAQSNLAHFEELAGTGYFCADNKGTVLIAAAAKNTELTENTMVLAYSNPDTVTVTVPIGQTEIAALTIGDTASVTVTDYGEYEGSITQIEPSSSGSKSNVTYNVCVTLNGDVSKLEANLSAQVTFSENAKTVEKGSMEKKSMVEKGVEKEGVEKKGVEKEGVEKEGVEKEGMEKGTGEVPNETNLKE